MFSKENLAIITESTQKGIEDGVNIFYRTLNSSIKQMDAIHESQGVDNLLHNMLIEHLGVEEIEIHECDDAALMDIYSELVGLEA